ncbi:transmembrane protein, putative [Rhizoctonia solani AG-3 Rhs1AP]|uniref:Transmembrane protein, putative n=1 Tax=Rhizoctonia solani AG-3 Rhs1AP TaxID=1086054 RepID=X8J5T5_9AGAM|nr:transmembrane protein, putative [Rhizoctonia solani AG-3 Rhs1AP]
MGVIVFRDHLLGTVSQWMENEDLHQYMRKHPDFDRYQTVCRRFCWLEVISLIIGLVYSNYFRACVYASFWIGRFSTPWVPMT